MSQQPRQPRHVTTRRNGRCWHQVAVTVGATNALFLAMQACPADTFSYIFYHCVNFVLILEQFLGIQSFWVSREAALARPGAGREIVALEPFFELYRSQAMIS